MEREYQSFFERWCAELDKRTGFWNCRCVVSNRLFINRATRERWEIPDPLISWNVVSRLIHRADLPGFEDHQSRALKCGGVHHCLVRFRDPADEWFQAWHSVTADICPASGRGVLLILVRPALMLQPDLVS